MAPIAFQHLVTKSITHTVLTWIVSHHLRVQNQRKRSLKVNLSRSLHCSNYKLILFYFKEEPLTSQKPPKPLRSPSLNLLDDHKLSKSNYKQNYKRDSSPKKNETIDNNLNNYSNMYLAEPAKVVDLEKIGQFSGEDNYYENNKELQNQPETFYSKSYIANKSIEDFYKENLKQNNEINQHNYMIQQSVQTQTDKIYEAKAAIEKNKAREAAIEQAQGFVRNNSDILNNRHNNSAVSSSKFLSSSVSFDL